MMSLANNLNLISENVKLEGATALLKSIAHLIYTTA